MKINLFWVTPFAAPFVNIVMFRLTWAAAGERWEPSVGVYAGLLGMILGFVLLFAAWFDDKAPDWSIKIGGHK